MEWVADNSALLEKSTIVQGKRERKLSNKIKWIMEEGVKTPPIPGRTRNRTGPDIINIVLLLLLFSRGWKVERLEEEEEGSALKLAALVFFIPTQACPFRLNPPSQLTLPPLLPPRTIFNLPPLDT